MFYQFPSWIQFFSSTMFFPDQLFLLGIFLKRHNSNFSPSKTNANCQMLLRPSTLWIDEVAEEISVLSHTTLFLLSCPSPACVLLLLLLVCFPYLLHSRQVILDLHFQVTFGDKLWEVCSRSTDTVAFIAFLLNWIFLLCLFKGEKVILLDVTSCPSAEPMNWILHGIQLSFLLLPCIIFMKKDAEREQGPLCITMALNVIYY